jgi:hypothetical protein
MHPRRAVPPSKAVITPEMREAFAAVMAQRERKATPEEIAAAQSKADAEFFEYLATFSPKRVERVLGNSNRHLGIFAPADM